MTVQSASAPATGTCGANGNLEITFPEQLQCWCHLTAFNEMDTCSMRLCGTMHSASAWVVLMLMYASNSFMCSPSNHDSHVIDMQHGLNLCAGYHQMRLGSSRRHSCVPQAQLHIHMLDSSQNSMPRAAWTCWWGSALTPMHDWLIQDSAFRLQVYP